MKEGLNISDKENPTSKLTNNTSIKNKSQTVKFDAAEFKELAENEYERFLPSSNIVGHALIHTKEDGAEVAEQFKLQEQTNSGPKLNLMFNIKKVKKFGREVYEAEDVDGKKFKAKRFLSIDVNDLKNNANQKYKLACFSPLSDSEFWGSKEENIPLFNTNMAYETKKDGATTSVEIIKVPLGQNSAKGGNEVTLIPKDIKKRMDENRNPSQNKIMGMSAAEYYDVFLMEYYDILSPEFKEKLGAAANATLGKNIRPEWLHIFGYTLTPKHLNPQVSSNLGASCKGNNTEMMVLERIARWFALNHPELQVKIKSLFTMVLDSEIVKQIDFNAIFNNDEKEVILSQNIPALQKNRLLTKPSDKAQGGLALYYLLNPDKKDSVVTDILDESKVVSKKSGMLSMYNSLSIDDSSLSPVTKVRKFEEINDLSATDATEEPKQKKLKM